MNSSCNACFQRKCDLLMCVNLMDFRGCQQAKEIEPEIELNLNIGGSLSSALDAVC